MDAGRFPRRNLHLTRAVLLALLAALIGLTAVSVHLYAQMTATAAEEEVLRSMQLSVRQTKNNLDYRLQQTADSARTLLSTVYPYLNSGAALEGQLAEYSEMNRVLNEYVGKYMIAKARLFVPQDKIYSRQGATFIPSTRCSGKIHSALWWASGAAACSGRKPIGFPRAWARASTPSPASRWSPAATTIRSSARCTWTSTLTRSATSSAPAARGAPSCTWSTTGAS